MKYTLTGSLGNITKPIAEQLVKAGHDVSIISSKTANAATIKNLGATPLIGNIEDASFLVNAFKGAEIVYLMIPPKWDMPDWLTHQQNVSDNYVEAIKKNNIKNVVVLSSIGAHMGTGAGPIDGLAYLESKINQLQDVNAVYLRPGYFYSNLYSQIPLIKNAGIMGANQPADLKMVLTHPDDIAGFAAERLLHPDFKEKQVQYIGSDEKTWAEITTVLAQAIGKENIPWVEFTDQQSFDGMLQAGLAETIANGYTNMGIAFRSGEGQSDYWKHHPAELGKTKLTDFAKEFAKTYEN